jgi:hypothetical protein
VGAVTLRRMQPGRPGVSLRSGEFVEGDLRSVEHGRLELSSPLFGRRRFDLNGEVSAAWLREFAAPGSRAYTLRLRNGSDLWVEAVAFGTRELVVRDGVLGALGVPWSEVRELKRASGAVQP